MTDLIKQHLHMAHKIIIVTDYELTVLNYNICHNYLGSFLF